MLFLTQFIGHFIMVNETGRLVPKIKRQISKLSKLESR